MSKGGGLTLSRAYLQSKREPDPSTDKERQHEYSRNVDKRSEFRRTGSYHSDRGNLESKPPTHNNKIPRRNFRFPGVFLPTVNHQTANKPRKSPTKVLSAVLSRRNLAMIPDGKSTMPSEADEIRHNKRATGTDITCLQLADTLMSYHKSPYSGFHGRDPLRTRHVDNQNDSQYVNEKTFVIEKQENKPEKRIPTPSYQTFQSERQRLMSPSSTASLGKESDISTKSQPMPRKSILKNVTQTSRPSSEKMYPCSYQLPGATLRMRPHSETRPSSVSLLQTRVHNLRTAGLLGLRDLTPKYEFTDSVRSVPVRLEKQTTFTLHSGSFQTTRKRMVRFNGANEVREFTPRGLTELKQMCEDGK